MGARGRAERRRARRQGRIGRVKTIQLRRYTLVDGEYDAFVDERVPAQLDRLHPTHTALSPRPAPFRASAGAHGTSDPPREPLDTVRFLWSSDLETGRRRTT